MSLPCLTKPIQWNIDSLGALSYHTVTPANMRISTLTMRNPKTFLPQNPLRVMMLSFLTLGLFGALSVTLNIIPAVAGERIANTTASEKPAEPATLPMEQKKFPQGTLYVLKVPANARYKVSPMISKTLASIDSQLWKTPKPLFIINGGFFDPNNSLTTSFVFKDGIMSGDPRINPQLVNNPKLVPYLPKIFNRTEFRVYLCQSEPGKFQTRYDIALHNAPIPDKCLLQDSLGAGPALLPQLSDFNEGFVDYNAAGKLTRDPIGVCAKNARSVVGITSDGSVILMMGAQDPAHPKSSGFTLEDMGALLKARGAVKAMALDGGSSSSLLYKGKAIFGRVNQGGNYIKRPVKSVLMVTPL
ncbi:MAG: putative periplasmic protein [Vampirovibrio sp.]|nr:putative periplasmic protein [Vampirovibrio sp.]